MIRRLKLKVFVVTGALLGVLLPGYAFADRRVALVVGNSQYQKVARLPNPANDAADVAASLKGMDFKVIEIEEADRSVFFSALKEFQRSAIDADVVVFFYAGHGIQVKGMNYFVPVEADVADQTNVDYDLVSIADVGKALDVAPKGIRIMILDTCRDNPLARSLNSDSGSGWINTISRGIILQNPPVSSGAPPVPQPPSIPPIVPSGKKAEPPRGNGGKIVVYATQSNQVAQDGSERNSPFTSALLKRLGEPGVEVGMLFRRVTSDVMEKTGGKQVPELSISLGTEYILNQTPTDAVAWTDALRSDDPEALRQFIARFPNSAHVPDAEHRISTIERSKTAVLAQLDSDKRASEEAQRATEAARENALRIAREKAEAERLAKIESDRKAADEIARATAAAQDNAKRLAREETERKAAAEAARLKAEQEHIAKLEADKTARDEAVRAARAEAEKRKAEEIRIAAEKEQAHVAKIEADRLARLEAERVAAAEKETARLAKIESDRLAKLEAERAAAALEKERQDKLAAAEAARKAREDAIRIAKAEEAERQAAAERERMAKSQADAAKREAEKLAAREDTERLAKLETERLAAVEREKSEKMARDLAARELATREEAAWLAQLADDKRKADEMEARVAIQRARLDKNAEERAAHDNALRAAAADALKKQQDDARRVAEAEAAMSAGKLAQDEAARAQARRLEAARIADLELEQKNAAQKLEAASKAEAERVAALAQALDRAGKAEAERVAALAEAQRKADAAAAKDSGAPAGGTQVASLDGATRTTDKNAVVALAPPLSDNSAIGEGPTPEAANAAFRFFASLVGQTALPDLPGSDKVASLDTKSGTPLPGAIDPLYNTSALFKAAQAELSRVGCYAGNESGNLNKGTRAALDAYGKSNGRGEFKADGEIKITARFVEAIKAEVGIICKPARRPVETIAKLPDQNEETDKAPAPLRPRAPKSRPQAVAPSDVYVPRPPRPHPPAAPPPPRAPTVVKQATVRPVTPVAPRAPVKGPDVNMSGF